jgi:hypothetical protein
VAKYLLLSILVATVGIPIAFARSKSAAGGLRKVVWGMVTFLFLWVIFCVYVYLRMGEGY